MSINIEDFLLQLNTKIDDIVESLHESCERLSRLEQKVSDDIEKRTALDTVVKEKELAVKKVTEDYRLEDRQRQNTRLTVMGLIIGAISISSSIILTLTIK